MPSFRWWKYSGRATPLPMVARFVPDPTHRHELRLHDGTGFTDQVMDGGVRAVDPYQ